MTNKKISDLTTLAAFETTDLLAIVDVSANASRKITLQNLIDYLSTISFLQDLEYIVGSTYKGVQDYVNSQQSSTYFSGGVVTENAALDGTVDITQVEGMIKIDDNDFGTIKFFTLMAQTAVALSTGDNYICIDYNSGAPEISILSSEPSGASIFIIYRAYMNSSDHMVISKCGSDFSNMAFKTQNTLEQVFGFMHGDGIVFTENGSRDRAIDVSEGTIYRGIHPHAISAKDSSVAYTISLVQSDYIIILNGAHGDVRSSFKHGQKIVINNSTATPSNDGIYTVESTVYVGGTTRVTVEELLNNDADIGDLHYDAVVTWYYNGAAWVKGAAVSLATLQWNNVASGLVTLNNNKYGVYWCYVCTSGCIMIVYGQGEYTLATAELAIAPGTLPGVLGFTGILAAKIIFKKSEANFYSITSAFQTYFPTTSPVLHNDLGSISGGAANDYYHLTSARHTEAIKLPLGATYEFQFDSTVGPVTDG